MIAACITTKNEAGTIGFLVQELLRVANSVHVVDAGSYDGTARIAAQKGAHVHQVWEETPIRDGMIRAWRSALNTGAEQIIQIDAGGSHFVYDAKTLLLGLRSHDVVVGSRFLLGSENTASWIRRTGSRFASHMCSSAREFPFSDWTSGYRAFRAKALAVLSRQTYYAKMHGWQIEVVDTALDLGMSVGERPITYHPSRSSLNRKVAYEAYLVWERMATRCK